jgi:hypothetical protein
MPGRDLPEPLAAAARRLATHHLSAEVRDVAGLRRFLEHHAVCVLDFMTLVKRLQAEVTCTRTPWVPAPDGGAARLINAIVLDEESDAAFGPEPASHYAWYLAAMDEVGADAGPIRALEARLRRGDDPLEAVAGCGLPPASAAFARTTFELAAGPPHVVAAAFVHGREDLLPRMFLPLVRGLRSSGVRCELFLRYLERHVELDGEQHGALAARLLEHLVQGDPKREREALHAAERALRARERLWDAAAEACRGALARA